MEEETVGWNFDDCPSALLHEISPFNMFGIRYRVISSSIMTKETGNKNFDS